MRIVYLTAGAADRFCGSCLHDNAVARALIKQGEDVLLVPTYTPLRTDEENVSLDQVFFGGINVYLQDRWTIFRHTPWFFDRWLDSPKLLNWLSRRAAGMDAAELGGLTVSTLQGEEGRQRKELEKLLAWLEGEARPQIVHLSNALLLGMAPAIRRRLRVPIVCGLAGEDWFIEQLKEPHYSQVRELLRAQAKQADHFVAYNRYFADFMADYIAVDPARISVIRHGIDLEPRALQPPKRSGEPMTIGYFGRIALEKGLDLLVEAFGLLAADSTLPPLRLRYGGYKSAADEPYFHRVQNRIGELNLTDRAEHLGQLDRAAKMAAIQSFDVMAVPTIYRESKGLSALEALANGVPIVAPEHGAFPELVNETAGGLLHEPASANDLAAKLRQLLTDRTLLDACGRKGREAIRSDYSPAGMASEHRRLYERLVADRDVVTAPPASPSAASIEIIGGQQFAASGASDG